jgi:hypothetical protein
MSRWSQYHHYRWWGITFMILQQGSWSYSPSLHSVLYTLPIIIITAIRPPLGVGTLHSYGPVGNTALFLRLSRTCWVEPLLEKSAFGASPNRGMRFPSGSYQFPTLPPSLPLQHRVLTCSVLHTRDVPGLLGDENSPMSVVSTASPGRYTVSLNVKYRPELGVAA